MRFLGIDPGQTGGMAVLDEEGAVIAFDIMRDIHFLAQFIKEHFDAEGSCQVVLEKAQVMAKQGQGMQGTVSMFNYGVQFGEMMGALHMMKIPFELIPPQTWTKIMHRGATLSLPAKEKSKVVVKRLFPGEDFRNPDALKARVMHDGIMDAILIAEFARRRWKGQI